MKSNSKIFAKILIFLNFISSIKIPMLEDFVDNITFFYFFINIFTFILITLLIKKVKIKGFIKYIVLYYLILFIPTFFSSHGDIKTIIYEFFTVSSTILIWNSFDKESFKRYLPITVFTLEMLTYINFVLVLLYPNGIYNVDLVRKYYLFGHINISIKYLLPGCCLTLIRSNMYKNKIDFRSVLYLVIVFLTLVITWPATALFGFILFIFILIVLLNLKKIYKFLLPNYMYVFSGIISYLIIVLNIQNYFSKFIENNLHKDLSFSGRTIIWQNALYYIKEKILLGYGRLSINTRYDMLNATSAHNQFLILVFEGGIILLLYFFILMLKISLNIKKCNNTKIVIILVSTITAYLVMWISEPFSYSGIILLFYILFLGYNSEKFFNINEGDSNVLQ